MDRLKTLVPEKQAEKKKILADHGNKVLGPVTVEQAYGGARGVQVRSLSWIVVF